MFELIPELNQLPAHTMLIGFFLPFVFNFIRNRNIEPPQMMFERPPVQPCIHFVSELSPASSRHPYFLIVWIAKCMKRKEKRQDDEDGHIFFPGAKCGLYHFSPQTR